MKTESRRWCHVRKEGLKQSARKDLPGGCAANRAVVVQRSTFKALLLGSVKDWHNGKKEGSTQGRLTEKVSTQEQLSFGSWGDLLWTNPPGTEGKKKKMGFVLIEGPQSGNQ